MLADATGSDSCDLRGMNTAEHPQAPAQPHQAERNVPQTVANRESSGVVLLSLGPLEPFWPIVLGLLVVSILTIAVPGLVLVAAVFSVFAVPYALIRRRQKDR